MSGKVLLGLAVSAAIGLGVSAVPAQAGDAPEYHPPKQYEPYHVTKGWLGKEYCKAVIENAVSKTVAGAANLKVIKKEKYEKDDNNKGEHYYNKYDKHKYPKKEKVTIICKFAPHYPVLVGHVAESEDFPCYQSVVKGYPKYTDDSFADIETKKIWYKGKRYNIIKKVLLKCTFEKPYERPHYPGKDKD
jgi:hypothetical protein